MKGHQYSPEQLQFLEQGYRQWSVEELTERFNLEFDTDRSTVNVFSLLKRKGFKCGRKPGELTKGKSKLFTQEQVDWLKENYPLLNRNDLLTAFNKKFDKQVTKAQLVAFLKNNKIKCGRSGHWGTKPSWNKGTKGVCKANSGSFKPGSEPSNRKKLYSERVDSRSGQILIKVPETCPHTGRSTRYVAKQRWVYQQLHGDIPEGMAVTFRDGNNQNFDPSNLIAISRRMLSILNTRNFFSIPDELKPSIWQLAELESATLSMTVSDGSKSQRVLVKEAIQQPRTSTEVADHTGIETKQVCTFLWLLKKKGEAQVIGTVEVDGKKRKLWMAKVS